VLWPVWRVRLSQGNSAADCGEYNILPMVVLALETVTPAGSLAIGLDARVVSTDAGTGTPHAARLPEALIDWLAQHGLTLADVDRLAVVSGPGSFTGVRIGMACAQGLAATRGWQVAAVSTLDAIAEGWRNAAANASPCTVMACLDGMRGEVFTALYEWDGNRLVLTRDPEVSVPSAEMIAAPTGAVHVVGNGAIRYADIWRAAGATRVSDVLEPLAGSAARLAGLPEWPLTSPHALRPVYVRRPDVELARDRRQRQDQLREDAL
jgi:tRNA threonylcarbamoyladenosine biosynthesis protein TsaB